MCNIYNAIIHAKSVLQPLFVVDYYQRIVVAIWIDFLSNPNLSSRFKTIRIPLPLFPTQQNIKNLY